MMVIGQVILFRLFSLLFRSQHSCQRQQRAVVKQSIQSSLVKFMPYQDFTLLHLVSLYCNFLTTTMVNCYIVVKPAVTWHDMGI